MSRDSTWQLPPFIPRSSWPEFDLAAQIPRWMHPETVPGNKIRGTRYGIWQLFVEVYSGTETPDITFSQGYAKPHNRLCMWHAYDTSRPIPKGWFRLSMYSEFRIGYATIPHMVPYYTLWSKRVQEYRRKWLRDNLDTTHAVELVTYEQFAHAYKKSPVGRKIGSMLLNDVERRIQAATSDVELWCVKNVVSGQYVAGVSFEYSKSCRSAYYIAGFQEADSNNTPSMVGLFDHIFAHAKERGMCYVELGNFWKKGNPRSWKGFSTFKSKFGITYVDMPSALVRFECVGLMAKFFSSLTISK
jgi:hypothetical protein